MKISNAFPSKYLRSEDLEMGKQYKVTIDRVLVEDVGRENNPEHKPVVYFVGAKKGMVLNKTNAMTLATLFGDETDSWPGREIYLFVAMTTMMGEPTKGLRLGMPQQPVTQGLPGGAPSQPMPDGRPTLPPTPQQGQGPGPGLPPEGIGNTLPDDEIPF